MGATIDKGMQLTRLCARDNDGALPNAALPKALSSPPDVPVEGADEPGDGRVAS